jgi:hypothetical protein
LRSKPVYSSFQRSICCIQASSSQLKREMWELIFAGLLVLVLIYWTVHSSQYPSSFPPGPRHFLPYIGDPLFAIGQDTTAGFDSMHKKYGKIVGFNFGGQKFVSISDLDILQKVTIYFLYFLNKEHYSLRPNFIYKLHFSLLSI